MQPQLKPVISHMDETMDVRALCRLKYLSGHVS